MKTENMEIGDVKSAFGKELPTAVKVPDVSVELYERREEIPEGKRLTDDQYVTAVNARIKAAARAKAVNDALEAAGYTREKMANDPEVIAKQQIALIVKLHGVSEDVAKQIFEAQQKLAESLKQPA